MSDSFMGLGTFLLLLPILIGQWIGIISLGKVKRNGAWWCMVSGIACATMVMLGSTALMMLMMFGMSDGRMSSSIGLALTAGGLSGFGSLIFAIGFALHGLQASRANQRLHELEAIAAAQGQELDRHRGAQGSAG